MMRRSRDRPPGDEAGQMALDEVLPTPYVAEERALRKELERLNGTWTAGSSAVIVVPRPGGGLVYLSGRGTLLSIFRERAFVMGESQARRLAQRYATVLAGAEVVVWGGETDPAAIASRTHGRRPKSRSQRPRGRAADESADDAAQHAGDDVEENVDHADPYAEQDQGP